MERDEVVYRNDWMKWAGKYDNGNYVKQILFEFGGKRVLRTLYAVDKLQTIMENMNKNTSSACP